MKNKHQNIKEELEELGIPLEHKPNMPLHVPNGYFDSFKKDMLDHVTALSFVDQLPKEMPQFVSNDYFEGAKQEIIDTVLALDAIDKLPKDMPQQVPDGYFETSKHEIFAKINKEFSAEQDRGLQLNRTNKRKTWALAASIALIISIGLFFMNSGTNSLNIENELAQIPAEMIDNYIDEHKYDFEAYNILENPEIITKDMQSLEEQILNETKTLSNEEIFEFVL